MGQITSSMEKQELLLLETTLGNLYHWKEEIVMAPPGRAANGLMIYIHSTVEIDRHQNGQRLHLETTIIDLRIFQSLCTKFFTS